MNTLYTCLAVVVLMTGCGISSRFQDVADVTKPETVILKKNAGQGYVHYLTVTGSGEIKGTAEISLIENGKAYRTEKLSGPVSFQWNTEWYTDDAAIRYNPSSVTGGNVRLKYKFKD